MSFLFSFFFFTDVVFTWARGPPVDESMWKGNEPNSDHHYCSMVTGGPMVDKLCDAGITSPYIKCVVYQRSCDTCPPSISQLGSSQMAVLQESYRLEWYVELPYGHKKAQKFEATAPRQSHLSRLAGVNLSQNGEIQVFYWRNSSEIVTNAPVKCWKSVG